MVSFIEVLGPAGSGKTTLINSISAELKTLGIVSTRKLVIGALPKLSPRNLIIRLSNVERENLWATPDLLRRNLGLDSITTSFHASKFKDDYNLLLETHLRILWASDSPLQRKILIQKFYINLLLCHQLISNKFENEHLFSLFDEGILSNTRGVSPKLLAKISKKSNLLPKILVVCECNPDITLTRRNARDRLRMNYIEGSKSEVLERRTLIIEQRKRTLELAKHHQGIGSIVIKLDISDLENAKTNLLKQLKPALYKLGNSI